MYLLLCLLYWSQYHLYCLSLSLPVRVPVYCSSCPFIPVPASLFVKAFFFLPVPYSATSWQTVKNTFIDLPADVVPYELLYRMKMLRTLKTPLYFFELRTEQFVCPIYSTPFDVSYVPYEIIQSDSHSKRPISRNSITFDASRSKLGVLNRRLSRIFSRALVSDHCSNPTVSTCTAIFQV